MRVSHQAWPNKQRPNGQFGVVDALAGKLEGCALVSVVQFDACRHLRNVVVRAKFFLAALLIFDNECVIDAVIVDEWPMLSQLWPDAFAHVILHCFE